MKYIIVLCSVVLFTYNITAQPKPEVIDSAMIAKIKEEGMKNSKTSEILSWLTDVYGPRLTGSPGHLRATEWVQKKLQEWKLENVHRESWFFGKGWQLKNYSAMVIGEQNFPLISYPKAWTPGVEKEAEFVYFNAETDSAVETFRGKLKNKFVLLSKPVTLKVYFEPQATRVTDSSLLTLSNAAVAADKYANYQYTPEQKAKIALDAKKLEMCQNEGAAAVLTTSSTRNDLGTVFVMDASVPQSSEIPYHLRTRAFNPKAGKIVPQIQVGAEHYNRIVRMLEKKQTVKLKVDLEVEFFKEDSSYNVIAEIPGTDLKDEIVMIGAHLDSWHAGTGATDNATGVTACMEAVRILQTIGAKPRRTIRIALWSGEEQGLLGSKNYVKKHFGVKDTLKPAAEKFAAYFNNDNGTGKVRGIYMQNNEALRPIFRSWLEPFKEMGASTLTIQNTSSTDHQSFDNVGLPGFQFIQDPIEYFPRTWHSSMDVFERAQEEDMKQAAILMAAFAYNAAMRDEKLPRKISSPTNSTTKGVGFDDEHDHSHE